MNIADRIAARSRTVWYDPGRGDAEGFDRLVSQELSAADWPQATGIAAKRIPVYDAEGLPRDATGRAGLMAEWARVFRTGPGVLIVRGAAPRDVVDRASAVFDALIERQRADGTGGGDPSAAAAPGDRIRNAAQKHCLAEPESFAAYYACDALALAATAWVGPGYQVTAQVDRVDPGGAAQAPHRGYHLGAMSGEQASHWPAHLHALSPALTLQGAISHCDMDMASGPTMLLPFSQLAPDGYVTFHREDFRAVFDRRHVQVPMQTGDAIFFNPAVMHGAGANRTKDQPRMVNLLQVASAFGRAMEAVDRVAMAKALYPVLLGIEGRARNHAVAACAEGYPFPTRLDANPPRDGTTPESQADLMRRALADGWEAERFAAELDAMADRDRA